QRRRVLVANVVEMRPQLERHVVLCGCLARRTGLHVEVADAGVRIRKTGSGGGGKPAVILLFVLARLLECRTSLLVAAELLEDEGAVDVRLDVGRVDGESGLELLERLLRTAEENETQPREVTDVGILRVIPEDRAEMFQSGGIILSLERVPALLPELGMLRLHSQSYSRMRPARHGRGVGVGNGVLRRAGTSARRDSDGTLHARPTDAGVIEPELAHAARVEQVAAIEDDRLAQQPANAVEVRLAVLLPLGDDDECIGIVQRIIIRVDVADP